MHHTRDRKQLKIGYSDYRQFINENGYFVDKTPLIKEFIDSPYLINLIPRPRRFGNWQYNFAICQCIHEISIFRAINRLPLQGILIEKLLKNGFFVKIS